MNGVILQTGSFASTPLVIAGARSAADELDELCPPATVADPHARMVLSMRASADRLSQAADLTGDAAGFSAAIARANVHATNWTAAFEEIRAAGYATVTK